MLNITRKTHTSEVKSLLTVQHDMSFKTNPQLLQIYGKPLTKTNHTRSETSNQALWATSSKSCQSNSQTSFSQCWWVLRKKKNTCYKWAKMYSNVLFRRLETIIAAGLAGEIISVKHNAVIRESLRVYFKDSSQTPTNPQINQIFVPFFFGSAFRGLVSEFKTLLLLEAAESVSTILRTGPEGGKQEQTHQNPFRLPFVWRLACVRAFYLVCNRVFIFRRWHHTQAIRLIRSLAAG